MLLKREDTLVFYLSWDWRENCNWKQLLDSINTITAQGHEAQIYEMNTKSDEETIIICKSTMSKEEAIEIFDNWGEYFEY